MARVWMRLKVSEVQSGAEMKKVFKGGTACFDIKSVSMRGSGLDLIAIGNVQYE